jgi:acetyl esterase/lipase
VVVSEVIWEMAAWNVALRKGMTMRCVNTVVTIGILLAAGFALPAFGQSAGPKAYYVDGAGPGAADTNPGTEASPWKTLHRVTTAKELQPGDTVSIKSIFRERMTIKVGGEAGKPLWYEWVPAQKYSPRDPNRMENVEVTPDVAYGYKDGMAMTFDVLKPKHGANGAGILVVMSGAWYSGHYTIEQCVESWELLLARGFTMFIVYHPSGTKYLLPEIVDSMHRSVRFIRLNAKRFGVDPDRLGAVGGSSGGHLSLMLATTADDGDPKNADPVLRVSDRLATVVAYFPPTDIRPWFKTDRWKDYLAFRFDPAIAGEYSPALHVSDKTSPMLLIHGDKDTGVPLEHSEKMYAELQKNHVPSELIVVRGGGHGFRGMDDWSAMVARDAWFETHLLPHKP